ncbi:uncharacterized protein CTRU02_208165 [Colletotrichum truncatum]|uniref:Uncharacterized protein n=1 Tax=Colletotrichum truncatum TaxID=5467 RepID=A0ACC3YVH4_COLTU|nr:uncharacterized protein CTRU02_07654 [Colletotrichum truncatum]KAF6791314.1 hypothetical protein CTRU02_07654 [Colletotrichum truncatum]
MTAVRRSKAVNPENDPQKEIKVRHGISPNYGGDASIARNHSADIPHTKNCSLWITNLPPHCTHNMLLSQIQGMGRIYCCVINPPQQSAGHSTAAAKVVFFELSGAQNFYTMCSDPRRRLIVGGMVARVSLNRIKSAEFEPYGNKSRVLLIQGNVRCVNEESLTAWFKERFQFDKDEVITHFHNSEMGFVEFRFGSWRCQAEAARIALLREYEVGSAGGDIWSVRYGIDPCSV